MQYNGKEYQTKDLILKIDGEWVVKTIATTELEDAMGDPDEFGGEEERIDEEIYFYVEPSVFELDGKIIAAEHLDDNFIGMDWFEDFDEDKCNGVDEAVQEIWKALGIDTPVNHDAIVLFCYNDVEETADPIDWHSGDVAIAFRRWIEAQK